MGLLSYVICMSVNEVSVDFHNRVICVYGVCGGGGAIDGVHLDNVDIDVVGVHLGGMGDGVDAGVGWVAMV